MGPVVSFYLPTENCKCIVRRHKSGPRAMKLTIPELSFVVLIGVSGSGKSTFARKHFKPTEILSSDYCRGLVSDDENSQAATKDAFELLHFIARFRHIRVLKSLEEIEAAVIERQPLWNNLKHEHGPFDIIGDVHGCFDELVELLGILGYEVAQVSKPAVSPISKSAGLRTIESLEKIGESAGLETRDTADLEVCATTANVRVTHPQGRKLVFVGDLVDRGPKISQVLKLVMNAVASGAAFCVPGNHDVKLVRKLRGREVQITHGLAESLAQLANEPEDFRKRVAEFIDDLVSHYVLDDGKLVVAHAGMKETMQGRGSGAVREFALFGETTGETDEFGLPVRYNWAEEYRLFVNSRSASNRSNASSARNHCAACMKQSSACSRWKANRLIHDCENYDP